MAALFAPVVPAEAAGLAETLIAEFGSIGRILSESDDSLRRVIGNHGEVIDLLSATERLIEAKLRDRLPEKNISATDPDLIHYLRSSLGSQPIEKLLILFLDNRNGLLAQEEFGCGTPNRLFAPPRNIVKRALELNACGIILVHNHPAGDPMPSASDVKQTSIMGELCSKLEIKLHDHIVITAGQWTSFRQLNLL